ncbi:MAG: ABC transporter permease [Enterocloster asparagiformis]|nr:ABC transporter permease [Enterocloster asparagiformis]
MRKFILKRLCTLIPVLIVVSILVFLMVHVMPGDPARIMAGDTATEQDVEKIRVAYGFDRPLYEQYFRYISKALRGDFGTSFRTGRPVAQEIAIRFPNTMLLAVAAIVISIVFGIGIGLISATKRNSIFDSISMVLALVGLSIPPFYLGLMLMLIFCVILKWLPITAEVSFVGMILPSLTLSARSLATIARMTRSSMLEVMSQDYILTAKAQGFNSRKIIFSHALKNAMNSIVTVAGIQFGTLLGGSVITEKVYGWPGLGELVITAIKARDFPVVQTTILVIAVSFVAVNLFVDVLYVLINPRIKYV